MHWERFLSWRRRLDPRGDVGGCGIHTVYLYNKPDPIGSASVIVNFLRIFGFKDSSAYPALTEGDPWIAARLGILISREDGAAD
jgi:hypothetical protein